MEALDVTHMYRELSSKDAGLDTTWFQPGRAGNRQKIQIRFVIMDGFHIREIRSFSSLGR